MKKLLLFSLLFCISLILRAQLSVDAQLRPRLEFRDGVQRLLPEGTTPAVLISQRTRLAITYQTNDLKIRIVPQDVRVWGDEQNANLTGNFGDQASFDMLEGFVEAKLKDEIWISAGRQQLHYDDGWLISDRNWNQHGSSWDAVVLKTKPAGSDLHIGAVWNNFNQKWSDHLYPSSRVKSINYLWFSRNIFKKTNVSLLYMNVGVTKNDSSEVLYYRHTAGVRGEHKREKLYAGINAYYQTGVNTKGKPVSAMLGAIDVRYSGEKYLAGLSIAYLSGNSKTGAEMKTDQLFDMHFGARHKFFGFMDYFTNHGAHTAQGGLVDYALTLNYKFSKKVSIRNIFHHFRLAQTNMLTGANPDLGFENDLIFQMKTSDWGMLELGYCLYLPSETLKLIQNVNNPGFAHFAYVQFTVNTNIFSQKQD
jgi:hypothetical protein